MALNEGLNREELARQVEEALNQVKEAHDTLELLVREMREEDSTNGPA